LAAPSAAVLACENGGAASAVAAARTAVAAAAAEAAAAAAEAAARDAPAVLSRRRPVSAFALAEAPGSRGGEPVGARADWPQPLPFCRHID
jgi:hypothetical protein